MGAAVSLPSWYSLRTVSRFRCRVTNGLRDSRNFKSLPTSTTIDQPTEQTGIESTTSRRQRVSALVALTILEVLQASDRPFFVAMGILGGVYVVLIVAMLLADVAYLAIDRRVKTADIDFQWDDSGRLVQHGDRISNQYDRLGLMITSHSPDQSPTIFEYLPGDTATEPPRLPAPVLGIGQVDNDSPNRVLPSAAAGDQLVFQWTDPVELTMVDLAHLPAAPGMTLRLLNAEGKTLQVRQVDESGNQSSLTVQIGDTPSAGIANVSKLVIELPRGGFVARLKYLWIGRQLAPWEKDHPVLSRIVYNPLTEALRKPEIRYSIKLSLISCTITAIISLWVAIPIGYLLSRYRFPGRNLIDAIVVQDHPLLPDQRLVAGDIQCVEGRSKEFRRFLVAYPLPKMELRKLVEPLLLHCL